MILRRITQQGDESLEEHYTNFGGDDNRYYDECGRMMLMLFEQLRSMPPHSIIWAHTSMNYTVLDDADDYQTSFGRISAWNGTYFLSFGWLPSLPPTYSDLVWGNARAHIAGQTGDIQRAAQMIISMSEYAPRGEIPPRQWFPALSIVPPPIAYTDSPLPLHVVAGQDRDSIIELYRSLSQDSHPYRAECAQSMLQLIEHLETTTIAHDLWVYCENEELVFVTQDQQGPGITVEPLTQGYTISYPWSNTLLAWEDACVEAQATDPVKALELILAARAMIQ